MMHDISNIDALCVGVEAGAKGKNLIQRVYDTTNKAVFHNKPSWWCFLLRWLL